MSRLYLANAVDALAPNYLVQQDVVDNGVWTPDDVLNNCLMLSNSLSSIMGVSGKPAIGDPFEHDPSLDIGAFVSNTQHDFTGTLDRRCRSQKPCLNPDCLDCQTWAIATLDAKKTCRICFSRFETPKLLEKHAADSHHRIYVCDQPWCSKDYCRRDVLIRHKATHRQGHLHACTSCSRNGISKAFRRRDHLTQHSLGCLKEGENVPSQPVGSFDPPDSATAGLSLRADDTSRHTPHRRSGRAYRCEKVEASENALTGVMGSESDVLEVLKKCWSLHDRATKDDVAHHVKVCCVVDDLSRRCVWLTYSCLYYVPSTRTKVPMTCWIRHVHAYEAVSLFQHAVTTQIYLHYMAWYQPRTTNVLQRA
ncbi:zinc finger protein [Teratosphaeria destructans]|uniref:Zinc finger protein n=1 Tax=Teratosphaeria destructans TaxID=418781 RepID=A0A9W7SM37_9PEZI|nr:zinc finger protein [Teratosphaeria destructans]